MFDKIKEDIRDARSKRCAERTTRLDLLSYDGGGSSGPQPGIEGLEELDKAMKDAIVYAFERREQAYAREVSAVCKCEMYVKQ